MTGSADEDVTPDTSDRTNAPDDGPVEGSEYEYHKELANSTMVELFSRPAVVRILTVLIDAGGADMSPGQITDRADLSRNAWYDNRDLLLELDLVEETRKAGNTHLYRANMEAERVQTIRKLMYLLDGADILVTEE